jgi:RecB family exonuclease
LPKDVLAISHSEIRSFSTCRRRWYLAYVRNLRPKNAPPTGVVHVGGNIHLALEGMHGYGLDPVAVLRWAYAELEEERPEYEKELRKELDLALAMVEGYVQWTEETGIDAGLTAVATEHEILHEIKLPGSDDKVVLRGKLDVLFRRDDGRLQIRDYKTLGNFSKADLLQLDQQMRFYAMLLAFAFPDAAMRSPEILYLMIKRSKRTARAVPPFFAQETVSHNANDLNSTYLRAASVASEILQARRRLSGEIEGPHLADHRYSCPPTTGDFCSWGCPFLKICPMFDGGDRVEDAINELYEVGEPYAYYKTSRIERAVAALGGGK